MRKIKLFIFASIISLLISSCQGTREQELKKLDKLWGYCDNPHRTFGVYEYETCKRKEMAQRPSDKGKDLEPFNITKFMDAVNNGVTAVGIIDGRKQHSILFEIFSDKGSGTLIRK